MDKENVIYYKISRTNTNEETFLDFMTEFLNQSKKINISKYIIVMDNLSCHKTQKIINFFISNRINVIFNIPYMSQFNCVELAFRSIKQELYSNLYPT